VIAEYEAQNVYTSDVNCCWFDALGDAAIIAGPFHRPAEFTYTV